MTEPGAALTLGQMVDRAAARFPERTAVVFKDERISYAGSPTSTGRSTSRSWTGSR
jgi:hypothetical protein